MSKQKPLELLVEWKRPSEAIITQGFDDAMRMADRLRDLPLGMVEALLAGSEVVEVRIVMLQRSSASAQRDGDRTESAPRTPVVEPSLWDPEAEKAASEAARASHTVEEASEATTEPKTENGLPDAS
jgi:hypothetical protein